MDGNEQEITIIADASRASQQTEELKFLLREVTKIDPKVVVEIGAWRGYSAEVWKRAFNPEKLVSIEKTALEIDPTIRDEFTFVVGDSHSEHTRAHVLRETGGQKIDFLFIDGDHTYEGVKKDYYMYAPFMNKGGIVGFHDISLVGQKWIDAGVEVNKFWNELKDLGWNTKEFRGPEGTGTGLLFL